MCAASITDVHLLSITLFALGLGCEEAFFNTVERVDDPRQPPRVVP